MLCHKGKKTSMQPQILLYFPGGIRPWHCPGSRSLWPESLCSGPPWCGRGKAAPSAGHVSPATRRHQRQPLSCTLAPAAGPAGPRRLPHGASRIGPTACSFGQHPAEAMGKADGGCWGSPPSATAKSPRLKAPQGAGARFCRVFES